MFQFVRISHLRHASDSMSCSKQDEKCKSRNPHECFSITLAEQNWKSEQPSSQGQSLNYKRLCRLLGYTPADVCSRHFLVGLWQNSQVLWKEQGLEKCNATLAVGRDLNIWPRPQRELLMAHMRSAYASGCRNWSSRSQSIRLWTFALVNSSAHQ